MIAQETSAAPAQRKPGRPKGSGKGVTFTADQLAARAAGREAADRALVADFDRLPDLMYLRIRVVAVLFAVSVPTIWKWAAAGRIPKPRNVGPNSVAWTVGDVRRALRAATERVAA
jgi:predicted DNA-binding transcriptional regulator AlpA